MAACTHGDGLVVDGCPILLCAVAHSTWCEVYGTSHHADIGEGDIVERHVVLEFCPAYLFHAEYPFVVDDVGIGAVEPYGSVYAVEVEHEVMACGTFGQALYHLKGCLVVAVKEVHLESLDAHIGIVLASLFQLFVNNVEYRPQYDIYAFAFCIGDKFGQTYLLDGLHDVGLV